MRYFILLLILLNSCNMGRQYANFRFGGKSKHEEKVVVFEKTPSQDSSISATSVEAPIQKEITINDTLMVKKLPGNKKMVVLKEKKVISNSIQPKNKTNKLKQVSNKKYVSFNNENSYHKNYSPLKGKNLNREIWITIIIASVVIGVIAYIISDSLFTAILISVLAAIGISLLIALAICIAVFLVFCVFLELIESL